MICSVLQSQQKSNVTFFSIALFFHSVTFLSSFMISQHFRPFLPPHSCVSFNSPTFLENEDFANTVDAILEFFHSATIILVFVPSNLSISIFRAARLKSSTFFRNSGHKTPIFQDIFRTLQPNSRTVLGRKSWIHNMLRRKSSLFSISKVLQHRIGGELPT